MIEIQFLDCTGKEIKEGYLLKVKSRPPWHSENEFYVRFEIKEDYIIPHDTFCWDSLEIVDSLPIGAVEAVSDGGYTYWYGDDGKRSKEEQERQHSSYIFTFKEWADKKAVRIIKHA